MNDQNSLTKKTRLYSQMRGAISSLLVIVICTAINLVLLVSNSESYFLFSAYIPYYVTSLAMYLCGMYPADYYMPGDVFLPGGVFAGALGFAVAFLCVFLLAYFFCKKEKTGWLLASIVLFVLDTVALVLIVGFEISMIVDYAFHAWALISLILGIIAFKKIKKFPPDEIVVDEVVMDNTENAEESTEKTEAVLTENE